MNELITIDNVRGYLDDNGTAYLSLDDVSRGLGFVETKEATNASYIRWNRVCKYLEEIGFSTCGETLTQVYIPENIFYKLCFKANNDTAREFQDKVCDYILPQIRKTGGYIPVSENESDEDIMAKAYIIAQRTLAEKEKRISGLKEQIELDKPKVIFADSVAVSHTTILIGELAKILRQNGIKTGQNKLFETLRNQGYLIKRKGADWNMPTQKSMELGLFKIKETTRNHADGHTSIDKVCKVTGKGQLYFINKFLKQ